ncbi:MAG TPA: nuclear transport factor 2 family protein [Geobacteraceae bacterium]
MGYARLWLGLLLLTSCARGSTADDEAAIREVAEQRRQAIIARNPANYRPLLSPSYFDQGVDANAKLAELAKTLLSQEIIDFRTTEQRITVSGAQAVLHDRYRLQVISKGNHYEFEGEETIRLRKETGGWKISGGL